MTEQHLNRNRVVGPYIIAACISCVNYGILIAISGYMGWVTGTWVAILQVIPGHSWTWAACFLFFGSAGLCVVGNPRFQRAETIICFLASLWLFIVGCFFVYSVFHNGTPSNAALAWFVSFVFGYYAAGTLPADRRPSYLVNQFIQRRRTKKQEYDTCRSKRSTSMPETPSKSADTNIPSQPPRNAAGTPTSPSSVAADAPIH